MPFNGERVLPASISFPVPSKLKFNRLSFNVVPGTSTHYALHPVVYNVVGLLDASGIVERIDEERVKELHPLLSTIIIAIIITNVMVSSLTSTSKKFDKMVLLVFRYWQCDRKVASYSCSSLGIGHLVACLERGVKAKQLIAV